LSFGPLASMTGSEVEMVVETFVSESECEL
jgi:hypothetical protein